MLGVDVKRLWCGGLQSRVLHKYVTPPVANEEGAVRWHIHMEVTGANVRTMQGMYEF